jgi:tetratricopeptide (TPR) repeat protein
MKVLGKLAVVLASCAAISPAGAASAAFSDDAALDPVALDRWWDFTRPVESEARFRAELERLPPTSAARLELLTQIARAQGLDRRFDAANATLDQVAKKMSGRPGRVAVRYLLERGRVYNSSGAPEKAVPLFGDALERARAAKEDFLAIDAAHMLGIAAPSEQRLKWNLEAVAMTEQTQDARSKRWLASLYNNVGWTYHDRGDYTKALDYFERALPLREARGDPANVRVAWWAIARAYRSLGRYDDALAIQRRLLEETIAANAPDGYVYEELGELLLARGEAKEARAQFARAYELLSADAGFAVAEPKRLARMRELAGASVTSP